MLRTENIPSRGNDSSEERLKGPQKSKEGVAESVGPDWTVEGRGKTAGSDS